MISAVNVTYRVGKKALFEETINEEYVMDFVDGILGNDRINYLKEVVGDVYLGYFADMAVASTRSDAGVWTRDSDGKEYTLILQDIFNVTIDDKEYNVTTIKEKPHRKNRDIKEVAKNKIVLAPGRHKVKIVHDGKEVFNKEIFISASEVKIIEL